MADQTSIGASDGVIATLVGGTPSTGPFAIDYPFANLDDNVVILTDVAGVATTLERGPDYTIDGTANGDGLYPSGIVTLVAAIANTTITRYRRTSIERSSQLPLVGFLDRGALNADLNRLTMALQDFDRRVGLYLSFPEEELSGQVLPSVADRAGKTFIWDAQGNAAAGVAFSTDIVFNDFMENTFFPASDASQARMVLEAAGLGDNNSFTGTADFAAATTVPDAGAGDNDGTAANTKFVQAAVGRVYIQKFTATGTYTPHAGMVSCMIECQGAAGGGGGVAGDLNAMAGACGGAGGYSMLLTTAAVIGASKAVTIGAAGTGGAAGNNNGSAGGQTSVGTICIAKGGGGGQGMGPIPDTAQGGLGGVLAGAAGDVVLPGAPGASGMYIVQASGLGWAGNGGSSRFGAGGRGVMVDGASTAGGNGVGYGAGGAGAASRTLAADAAGGDGTAGFVLITEYCNR